MINPLKVKAYYNMLLNYDQINHKIHVVYITLLFLK